MNAEKLQLLKVWLRRVWLLSPERLWLASIALDRHGHWVLAFSIKQLNTLLYHNSLAPGASVSPDVQLGHNSIGIVVTGQVEIGRRVKLWHNVTLTAGRPVRGLSRAASTDGGARASALEDAESAADARSKIILEDGVKIGANAVIVAPRGRTLRIGRGARVGAGTVVTEDVPPGATVVSQPARVLLRDHAAEGSGEQLSELEQP